MTTDAAVTFPHYLTVAQKSNYCYIIKTTIHRNHHTSKILLQEDICFQAHIPNNKCTQRIEDGGDDDVLLRFDREVSSLR